MLLHGVNNVLIFCGTVALLLVDVCLGVQNRVHTQPVFRQIPGGPGRKPNGLALAASLAGSFDTWQSRGELLALPGKNFAYCALPRAGSTLWKQLLLRVEKEKDLQTTNASAIHDPVRSGLHLIGVKPGKDPRKEKSRNITQLLEVFTGEDPWFKAVIVRDPVTRLLSSYLDRCVEKGELCYKVDEGDSDTPATFSEVLDALEGQMAKGSRIEDLDFRPQVDMCGLKIVEYDFVGRFERFDLDSRKILKRSGLWQSYGNAGWESKKKYFSQTRKEQQRNWTDANQELSTSERVCEFYNPATLRRVEALYSEDFKRFGYRTSRWTQICTKAWTANSEDVVNAAIQNETGGNTSGPALPGAVPAAQAAEGNQLLRVAPDAARLASGGNKLNRPWGSAQCSGSMLVIANGGDPTASLPNATVEDSSLQCRPTLNDFAAMPRPIQDRVRLPSFYLHEDTDIGFQNITRCFLKLTKISSSNEDDFDNHVKPNVAEHLGELWLLRRLRRHPRRVYDENKAELHILGAPLYISRRASQMGCGTEEDHIRRLTAWKKYVTEMKSFQRSQGANIFVAMTHWDLRNVFTEDFMDLLNRSKIIVGTADAYYRQWQTWPNVRKVILPYKAHFFTESQAWRGLREGDRNTNFMFHGALRQSWDPRMGLLSVANTIHHSEVNFLNFQEMEVENFKWHALRTAQRFANSRFCLVPAGDTPTTRRLFDALASGCVPVILADFRRLPKTLPFPSTVDWSRIAIFGGRIECAMANMDGTVKWLETLMHHEWAERCTRERGRAQFLRSLSYTYGRGLVNALLKELALGYLPKK